MKKFGIIIIIIFVMEIVARIYNYIYVAPYFPPLYQYDVQTGYGLRPNLNIKVGRGKSSYHIHINSLGLRDRQGIEKEEGWRILGLGDSFAMGGGIENEDSYLKILENRLNRLRKSVVINGAIAGFGTDNCLELFKKIGPVLKPDLVILGLYLGNDIRDNILGLNRFNIVDNRLVLSTNTLKIASNNVLSNNESRWIKVVYKIDFWSKQNIYLYRFFRNKFLFFKNKFNLGKKWMGIMSPETLLLNPSPSIVEEGLSITKRYLLELRDEVKKNGGSLMVMIIPFQTQVEEDKLKTVLNNFDVSPDKIEIERPQKLFTLFCQENGIKVLDIVPQMKMAKDNLYLPHDSHWNKNGHRLAGELLYNFIEDNF